MNNKGAYPQHLKALKSLNTDKTPRNWDHRTENQAPHKPFLLLSILDGIETGRITDNRINLDPHLIETFFTYWNGIMGEERKTTIALPFYHMQTEPFWELNYREGKEPFGYSPSRGALQDRVDHALIDPELFTWMNSPEGREQIRSAIVTTYFDEATGRQVMDIMNMQHKAVRYSRELEQFAAEPFRKDHTSEEKTYYRNVPAQARERGFRIKIRELYEDSCAVCRARVISPEGYSLVEGTHIIPWNHSRNDDPRNGLALCGTHHWLFDRYLFTVDDHYAIQLSGWTKKHDNNIEELYRWEGQTIKLPEVEEHYPSPIALEDHRERFGEVNG